MPGVVKRNIADVVYEAVDANIVGGQLCVPSTTATVSGDQGVATAGAVALNVLGVASKDAVTEANKLALTQGTGPAPGLYPFADASVPSATLTLYNNCFCLVTYTAVAVAYGTKLKTAANGAVAAWVSGTDSPAAIIGFCAQPGGVSSAGGTALARILV